MNIILGMVLIVYGLIILSGRKFIINTRFYQLFILSPVFAGIWIAKDMLEIIFIQGIFIIWGIFILWNSQGYMIHNVNKKQIEEIVKEILEKNKIDYKENEETIILSKWYNDTKVITGFRKRETVQVYKKEIKITGDEVSAILQIKDVKGTRLYSEIFDTIKERLPFLEESNSSRSGWAMMLIGLIMIGVNVIRKYDILNKL
ncbi:MAG: hypothetical protein N4A62_02240 [Marinisporobacter sp.]|jgi:hypothetical protein|nr:hypothetical protein [Marinisporobacter sp.]